MTESSSFAKMSKIELAWLDELGLIHRFKDDLTVAEQEQWITRARTAAKSVDDNFRRLKAAGDLRQLGAAYKRARAVALAAGKRVKPWNRYVEAEKIRMVRIVAQAQRERARRGLRP